MPFSSIAGVSRLFRDYLSGTAAASPFYEVCPPALPQAGRGDYPSDRRAKVAQALKAQNQEWGASPRTLENIEHLARGANAIVTGQQVGLFGGPAFSIYKAISAVRTADELSRRGALSVPVFWLATQDHDFAEISSALLRSAAGELRHFTLAPSAAEGTPVGRIALGEQGAALAGAAAEFLGAGDMGTLLRECYAAGQTLASAMARMFMRLFADYGLIVMDPRHPELPAMAAPLYERAAERSSELALALAQRGRALAAAGYHEQVKVTANSTLLFLEVEGLRTAVKRNSQGFVAGRQHLSPEELLQLIRQRPQDFSGNALLRPVVQDFLLPTVAVIGGPAEIAYFAQAGVVYQELLGHVTPILPRLSATLLDARDQRLLTQHKIEARNLIERPATIAERVGQHSLPQDLKEQFESTRSNLGAAFENLGVRLTGIDPTLGEAAARAASKVHHQITQLEGKAVRARLRREAELRQHAQTLSDSLMPQGELQERQIAGISYVARYGPALLQTLYSAAEPGGACHHLIAL